MGEIATLCRMIELGFAPVISRFASHYLAAFRELSGLGAFSPGRQEPIPLCKIEASQRGAGPGADGTRIGPRPFLKDLFSTAAGC